MPIMAAGDDTRYTPHVLYQYLWREQSPTSAVQLIIAPLHRHGGNRYARLFCDKAPLDFAWSPDAIQALNAALRTFAVVNSPGSARLTLRFQSVRTSDDKEFLPNHTVSVYNSSVTSRHLSCYSSMEARADGYTYNGKKEEPSTTTITSTASDVVSSSSPLPSSEQGLSSMAEASTLNGSTSDTHGEDALSEEPLRKRRRSSNDSTNGTLTPTGKGRSSRGDKARASDSDPQCPRKRGNNSSSDTESGPSEQEMDGDPSTQDSYGNGHSPKVPPLKIVLPSSGTGNLEGAEPAGGANSKERKVSSSKPALPYVVNATESLSEGSPSEQAVEEKERRREEERCQRVTRSSHRAALTHDEEVEDAPEGGVASPIESPPPMEEVSQPVTNGFQMYLDIRKQVEKRRQAMLVVHPKPPQGFKDYLLNRGSYVLEGNPSSRLSVPMIPLPQSLSGSPMRDLFLDQERERYKLRLQHLIEREKLVLSAEQEILRVHGRAARAIQNQAVPLSACSILRDEEIYNVLKPEQICVKSPESIPDKKDDKDKNVRSRYNGRLFLSWLQDVEDKWEKTKEKMLLRQHNEAESLHAVQKLDWEWKLKELGLCEVKATPVIDDICVPSVHVSDEFDVLPA
ncbi:hypothetical protein MTO96_001472 [Rhipicephalus appendiculatus]